MWENKIIPDGASFSFFRMFPSNPLPQKKNSPWNCFCYYLYSFLNLDNHVDIVQVVLWEGDLKSSSCCAAEGETLQLPKQSCFKVIKHVLEPDVNEITFFEDGLIYRYLIVIILGRQKGRVTVITCQALASFPPPPVASCVALASPLASLKRTW